MADQKNDGAKFGIGVLVGTVLGGLAAFFLSPNSGKENREMVMDKFEELKSWLDEHEVDKKVKHALGDVSEESVKLYKKVARELSMKMGDVKEAVENIDKEKYMEMVEDIVNDAKKDFKVSSEKVATLKKHFLEEWERIMSQEKKVTKRKK